MVSGTPRRSTSPYKPLGNNLHRTEVINQSYHQRQGSISMMQPKREIYEESESDSSQGDAKVPGFGGTRLSRPRSITIDNTSHY